MISEQDLDLLDRFAWILIYAGMILVVLGFATRAANAVLGWSMGIPGCIAVIAGIVLIAIRPRLDARVGSAQSGDSSEQGKT